MRWERQANAVVAEWPAIFSRLTGGRNPWRWQREFGDMIARGRYPATISMPTGFGKTATITVWLSVLAHQLLSTKRISVPRRLAYVVHSRTIVDQATEDVVQIASRLRNPEDELLREVADALVNARAYPRVGDGAPVLVSTLRGDLARDDSWAEDPSAVAIVIGTVDLIGSRLLFSGYGDGTYQRPHYAGLLGVDTLVLHDEAHLTPQFSLTLQEIGKVQATAPDRRTLPSFHVINLSATPTVGEAPEGLRFDPARDLQDEGLTRRITGKRSIQVVQVADACTNSDKPMADEMVKQAVGFKDLGKPVLVYVSSATTASSVAESIRKALGKNGASRVRLLSGMMRGAERERLRERDPVFARFVGGPRGRDDSMESVYLVSTAAGEVGVDLDAAIAVMDFLPYNGLWKVMGPSWNPVQRIVQRLGRVNRSGDWHDSRVVFVVPASPEDGEPEYQVQHGRVLAALERLAASEGGSDAVRRHLGGVDEALAPPVYVPMDAVTFDGLAATSVKGGGWGRPISLYLHGPTSDDSPSVSLVWRAEWPVILREIGDHRDMDISSLIERARPNEVVQCPVWDLKRVIGEFGRLREKRADVTKLVGFIRSDGELNAMGLDKIVQLADRSPTLFANGVLVLDPVIGGLNKDGVLDPKNDDVVEPVPPKNTLFVVKDDDDGYWDVFNALTGNLVLDGVADEFMALRRIEPHSEPVAVRYGDGHGVRTKYLVLSRQPKPRREIVEQTLERHSTLVREASESLCRALGIAGELRDSVVFAAVHHDDGKADEIWQVAARGRQGSHAQPMAKTHMLRYRELNGYRHEFGSLLMNLDSEDALALRMIAAHHKFGRPGFLATAAPPARAADAVEVGRRMANAFAAGNARWGPWGLAYLEALVRASDHRGGEG